MSEGKGGRVFWLEKAGVSIHPEECRAKNEGILSKSAHLSNRMARDMHYMVNTKAELICFSSVSQTVARTSREVCS